MKTSRFVLISVLVLAVLGLIALCVWSGSLEFLKNMGPAIGIVAVVAATIAVHYMWRLLCYTGRAILRRLATFYGVNTAPDETGTMRTRVVIAE